MPAFRTIVLLALCGLLGCSSRPRAAGVPTTQLSIGPATRAALSGKAALRLDEILPAPALPTTRPAGASAAPLDALELYARARDALAERHPLTAIQNLDKAIRLDPGAAELHRLLARAYLAQSATAKGIQSLSRALELAPDDADTRVELARLLLARGETQAAIDHLRLATQTRSYAGQEATAVVTDYFLAKALQREGYDRAALDQYEKVLTRLRRPTIALRSNAELHDWAARPEAIYSDAARLYEKMGENERALAAWKVVSARDPEDLDARSRVIDNLIALGKGDEALQEAGEVVRRGGPTQRAVGILRDAARRVGSPDAVYAELRRMLRDRPDDRALLFSIADLLSADGRGDEAEALLRAAVLRGRDEEIMRRLLRFYADRRRSDDAARLLIDTAAARPVLAAEITRQFNNLLRPVNLDALRANDVIKLQVAADAQAAKEYYVAVAALAGGRNLLFRESLDRAAHLDPLFPPALRLAMQVLGQREDLSSEQKDAAARDLIDRAARGPAGFADELRGIWLLTQGKTSEAAAACEQALKSRDAAPEAALQLAEIQFNLKNYPRFEQTIWRLISEYPTFDAAYVRLINYHLATSGNGAAALNALQRWLSNDPYSVQAKLTEAALLAQANQPQAAQRAVAALLDQYPRDPEVIGQAQLIFARMSQSPQLVQMLEEPFARRPDNPAAAEILVRQYAEWSKPLEAARVIESFRASAPKNPRTLIIVAQLYSILEQKPLVTAALEEALAVAPVDAGINNDLGYTWADQGVNLDRAEKMTRLAVEAEPDNPSYLDSLGWVLYKRGRFAAARRLLEQSVTASAAPDPVVLDHLGDTLYRLSDRDGAARQWRTSLQRLAMQAVMRDDLRNLRDSLEKKMQQAQSRELVDVAPLALDAESDAPTQAKK